MKLNKASLLPQCDSELSRIIELETERQTNTINLIASENHIHPSVIEAQSCLMTDKYAEGYPGHRYYGGCTYVDAVENLAIERARKLFKAEHANVQPHSGSQANMAAYSALVEHGDTIMGLSLSHGGHLTHGSKVNFSGKWYNFIPYGVDAKTEKLDYDEVEKLALKYTPKLIITGASAYPRTINFERFGYIADKVGAKLLADMAHIAGIVAAGLHPSPIPYAQVVTSTTQKTLRGPRGGFILCRKELASAIDAAVFPRMQGGPFMHIIAAKALCFFRAMQPEFVDYQRSVLQNAKILASELQNYGMRIVSGGTDNHIVAVDVSPLGVSGKEAEEALEMAGIFVNRNTIPFDPKPPRVTSGIRLGTPAITTRGFGTEEIKRVAFFISQVLSSLQDEQVREQIRREVKEMCQYFPLPGIE
ncbi:MAG: serine hydroxymethyltransferase [Chloroflexota bacterium]|nr:serine hydroxymethyltransferase [Chloroflexota bacterium]